VPQLELPPSASPLVDDAAGSSTGGRLSAALYTLVFLSFANLTISAARMVVGSSHQPTLGRIVAEIAVGGLSLSYAVRRRRHAIASRACAESSVLATVMEPESSLGTPALVPEATAPVRERGRRSMWLRRLRCVLVGAMMILGAISVAGQWSTVESAVGQLAHLNWRFVRWAVYAEAASIVAYAWLGRALLRAGRRRVAMGSMIAITLASNALASSVPAGAAWAASFSFEQFRRRGVGRGAAAFVLLLTVVLSVASLAVLIFAGVDLAGSTGPAASFRPVVTALVVALLIAVALVSRRSAQERLRRAADRFRGSRMRRLEQLLHRGLDEADGLRATPGILLEGLAASLVTWLTDCACLVAAILAVSGPVPWSGLLVIYGVTQIAENLPITPGGIGVVEGAMSLLLVAYGMPADTAVAAVLVYRIISFWVLVPAGWLAAGGLVVIQRRQRGETAVAESPSIPLAVSRPTASPAG
jgi:putative heme transporter